MDKGKAIALAVGFLCCLVLVGVASGQASMGYKLGRRVLANAGSPMSSAHFALNATFGQSSAIGPSQSTGFGLHAGYWGATMRKIEHLLYLPLTIKGP